ncbi:hypothetical protein I4F81_012442 [Pyropia yezoensis]|uniref:Uncharacterized protein n=1 Tax=Pyropia yezoensis TaxID=2788 RepID=A0ACC3CII2_PYRYE|nr:hypothetical protein I4F81_012442 [Neopyropia yezoensis]
MADVVDGRRRGGGSSTAAAAAAAAAEASLAASGYSTGGDAAETPASIGELAALPWTCVHEHDDEVLGGGMVLLGINVIGFTREQSPAGNRLKTLLNASTKLRLGGTVADRAGADSLGALALLNLRKYRQAA